MYSYLNPSYVSTGTNFANMMLSISQARVNAKTVSAQAEVDYQNARVSAARTAYENQLQEKAAAEQYAADLASLNNAAGAAGVGTAAGSVEMTAESLYKKYKDNMEIIGVNKSFAELEERRNLNALSAKKKSAKTNRAFQTAGALLSFGANTAVDLAMIDARNDRRERTKTKVEVNDAKTP